MIWNKAKAKPNSQKRKASKVSTVKKVTQKRGVKKKKSNKQVLLPRVTKTRIQKSTEKQKPILDQVLLSISSLAPTKKNILTRLIKKDDAEIVHSKVLLAFNRLHHEFNQREKQLEVKLQEIQLQHDTLIEKKRSKWLIPIALAAAFSGGYMLFVLTNMQHSMSSMTGSINNMNGYMANMSTDTQAMSQNMQAMNNSMYSMNGNVNKMTQAIEPIGDTAQTVSPFAKAFRSFMPF